MSIGVQSFDDTMLQAVGRVHDAAQARAAVAEAAEAFAGRGAQLGFGDEDVRRALNRALRTR